MSVNHEALLKLQNEVIVAASQAETVASALRAVLRVLCEGFGWRVGEFYRLTERRGAALEPTEIFYVAAERAGERRGRDELRELIESKGEAVERMHGSTRPVAIGPVAQRARGRWRRKPRALLFRVAADDRNLGALAFLSDGPIVLHEELESLMESIGIQLGLVIRRLNLEERLASHATEEQRRIGCELHDTLGQQVVGIGLSLRSLQEEMERAESSFAGRVSQVVEQLDRVSEGIRSIIDGLLPVEVEPDEFREVIEGLPAYCSRQYSIDCAVDLQGDVRPASTLAATNLVHIAREAIRNAMHHGGAQHVRISVSGSSQRLVLRIEDDGSGFSESESYMNGGHGLEIMRYRCRAIGGTLAIENRAGGGAVVTCTIPRPG
jgi:signal transduction histidine kinase